MKTKVILSGFFLLGFFSAFCQDVSDMLERTLGSVVTVAVYKMESDATAVLLGYGSSRGSNENAEIAYARALDLTGSLGVGSGFLIERNGVKYIVTNAHVVERATSEEGSIFVHSITRAKYEMKLVGGDSFYDLALLSFVDNPGPELNSVEIRTREVRIGERVFSIGNPGGSYPYSISDGIVGAMNRTSRGLTGKFGFIQHTATVIWGNSGGPLIDAGGNVVGVNSQLGFVEGPDENIYIQPQINLALEAEIVERIIDDILRNNGRVVRGYIGIEISKRHLSDNRASMYVNPAHVTDDLPVLSGVIENSPGYSVLGDKIGYKILRINENEVFTLDDVLGELENIRPGQQVTFLLKGDQGEEHIRVTSGELSEPHLVAIARYVLEKEDRLELLSNAQSVKISITSRPSQEVLSYKNKKFNPITEIGAIEYFVVSAGLITDQGSSSWRVSSLSSLGAAFRISGLQGVLDLRVVESNNPYAEPETLRFNLSDNSYVNKPSLWY